MDATVELRRVSLTSSATRRATIAMISVAIGLFFAFANPYLGA